MAQINNMTSENLQELESALNDMKKLNPDLIWNTYQQREKILGSTYSVNDQILSKLNNIEEELTAIHNKIDLIFGGNVLINGKFQVIKP